MTAKGDGRDGAGGSFSATADGGRWTYAGALTCANAGAVLAAAKALPLPATGEIDLADIGEVDSAAVAVMLALKRRAGGEGRPLSFVNVSTALASLLDLYDVGEIVAA